MIEPIATEIHDIEQQLIETNVKSILKTKIQNNNIRFTVFYNIILLFVIVPFIICDIYFALYDNCCMIENLRNFFFGSAFSTILLYIILVILSLHRPKRKMRQTFYKKIKNLSIFLFGDVKAPLKGIILFDDYNL